MGLRLFHITEFAQSMLSPASQREALHPAGLVLLASLWLAVAGNLPLWHELGRQPMDAPQLWWTGLCFALMTTGALMALLSAFNWRGALLRLAITVLVWLAALNTLLLWSHNAYVHPALLQLPWSQGLGQLRNQPVSLLLLGLGLLGVLPTVLLWRARVQRVAAPRMLPQNLLLFFLGTVLMAIVWFSGRQALLPLLQDTPRWLALLTPFNTLLSLRP